MQHYPFAPSWQTTQWFNTPQPLSLESLRGDVVLLHTFQMLCPGCVAHALPQAEAAHQRFTKEGVKVIGLHTVFEHHNAMTPVALEAFIQEYRLSFPIGIDSPASVSPIPLTMQEYGFRGTPSLVLIDRLGRIRLHAFGRVDDLSLGLQLGRLLSEQAQDESPIGIASTSSNADHACNDDGCPVPDKT